MGLYKLYSLVIQQGQQCCFYVSTHGKKNLFVKFDYETIFSSFETIKKINDYIDVNTGPQICAFRS